ncbi:hypothetical protein CRM22_000976 [Opisthorchis felineus]|uniref:Protein quiver n=1 Tax=Opisthorchis felineus TaxID=147828 RepID=A0A4V3SH07_OPIFE|nr:hypothetical protein CRM22_000976 [Opisthorchis felineus]
MCPMILCNTFSVSLTMLCMAVAFSADPDHCPGQRIHCYNCDSFTNAHCNDPFIRSDQTTSVPVVDCNAPCFKWALETEGRKRMVRNCSHSLNMKMEKYLVCITESRANYGFLCFCNKDRCNRSQRQSKSSPFQIFLLVICFLHQRWFV